MRIEIDTIQAAKINCMVYTKSNNNPSKVAVLLLLLIQNTGLALAVKGSKLSGSQYIASTAVLLNELVKFLLSAVFYYFVERRAPPTLESTRENPSFFQLLTQSENLLFVVPCLIYATQNNLVFVALDLLDAALYQVLANLKIITTAICSVIMLNKSLHRLQWMALLLLAIGEALAEASTKNSSKDSSNIFKGTMVMIFYAILSGFAGVFTEKILKKRSTLSFWMKSMILYFWGFVINLVYMAFSDSDKIIKLGFFHDYTWKVWLVIFLLSFGGILVSVVITWFDNIVKVYVTCCALFLTSVFSWLLFDFVYTMQFILAACIVSISILIYSDPVVQQ